MAQNLKKTEKDQNEARNVTEVIWDDTKMNSTYSNVCNVSSTREEVTLLFGTNQAWHTGQQQLKVELTDRIILNPYAAKRLSILLNNVMKEYETRFGALPIDLGPKAPETDK